MTRRDTTGRDGAIPVGTDADEQQDAGAVLTEPAAADEDGARRRRTAPEGGPGVAAAPGPGRWPTGSTTVRPASTSSAGAS